MIKGYPDNSNITILNTIYTYGNYRENIPDSMILLYKDLDTNEMKQCTINEPESSYFMLKSDASQETINSLNYPGAFYRNKKDYDEVFCKYNSLNKDIATRVGEEKVFYNNIKNGNAKANRNFRYHYKVESTDVDLGNYYRQKFAEKYKNNSYPLSKAFLDIEVDSKFSRSYFPEMGECPVNAITLGQPSLFKFETVILRDDRNPQIQEFEEMVNNNYDEFIYGLYEKIKQSIHKEELIQKYNFDKFRYKITFFDNEIDLIKYIFLLINKDRPDFTLAWNMAFDIPYLIARCKVLGYDPADILCDDSFEVKVCEYYIDTFHKNNANLRNDYANISSYSVYLDQMIHFATINSTKVAKYGNWKLDNIGNLVGKMRKLEYNCSIKDFPWVDFKNFIYYNIIDVLVQVAIEHQSNCIDYVFNKSLLNDTRSNKVHRQSIYLMNRIRKDYNDELVLCTNRNRVENIEDELVDDEGEEKGYPGAFVADPKLINDYSKTKVNGVPIHLYRNNVDFDYTALYPNTDIQFNVGHESLIGKVNINVNIENVYNYKYLNPGSYFIFNLQSNNFIEIGNKYLNLPDVSQMYNIIKRGA